MVRLNKKICVFRVTLPYLILLVKPRNVFHVFSKIGGTELQYLY